MGKPPYVFTDSETEDTNSCSSIDAKKKKKFSRILKYTTGNVKKKKCEVHSKSEPSDSDYRSRSSRSRSSQRVRYKLPGILKNSTNHTESSEEDEDSEPLKPSVGNVNGKFLVGRVPRPAGAKPGRGGGVAIIVRKNVNMRSVFPTALKRNPEVTDSETVPGQHSSVNDAAKTRSARKESWQRRLSRKRSY